MATIEENFAGTFTNILGNKPVGKYTSGARAILRINDELIGFAFGISWQINTEQLELITIDDYLPTEIVPNRIKVSGTIKCLHIPGQGPSKRRIQSDVLSFLAHNYISIEVRDSQTDELLFITKKAAITSRSEDVGAGALANITLQFVAIGWQDEMIPQVPKGIDGEEPSGPFSGATFSIRSPF